MSKTAAATARSQRPLLTLVWLVVAVASFDLGTKVCVERWAALRRLPFIHLIDNPGYTMGAGGSGWYLPLLSWIMIVTAWWWVAPVMRSGEIHIWPIGLAFGGAAGNVSDRTVHGQVTDFLVTPWLVINMADLAVFAGLLALALSGDWRKLSPTARWATIRELRRGAARTDPPLVD